MPTLANQNEQLFTQLLPYFPSLDKKSIPRTVAYRQETELRICIRICWITCRVKNYNLCSSYAALYHHLKFILCITFPNLKFFVHLSVQHKLLLSSFGVVVEMAFSSIFLSMLSAATINAAVKTCESNFFEYSWCYFLSNQ